MKLKTTIWAVCAAILLAAPCRANEGASGVSFRGFLPEWPTIRFPDGIDYRVSSLCVDGESLRVADKTHGPGRECAQGSFDGGCASYDRVELVTPVSYLEKTAGEALPRRHALSYRIPVYASTESSQPLFIKLFTIPACSAHPARPAIST